VLDLPPDRTELYCFFRDLLTAAIFFHSFAFILRSVFLKHVLGKAKNGFNRLSPQLISLLEQNIPSLICPLVRVLGREIKFAHTLMRINK
jgi:hypothetical protein